MKFSAALMILISVTLISCDTTETSLLSPTEKMILADKSSIPDSIVTLYEQFAVALALDTLVNNGQTKNSQIEISEPLKKFYLNALLHVYNFNHPARDSIITMYRINHRPPFDAYDIIAAVNPAKQFLENWRAGNSATGSPELDQLMNKYSVTKIDVMEHFTSSVITVLSFKEPMNAYAMANRFLKTGEFVYVEPNGYAGDGSRITTRVTDTFVDMDYSFGFGDCPAGCIARHWWTFRVFYDGTVEYLGSRGQPLGSMP